MGSIPTCAAHLHVAIIGQATWVEANGQIGHFWMGQQVVGSVPATTGCWPPGQTSCIIGQAAGGLVGSHFGGTGTHWAVQVCPAQLPPESQLQAGSPAGQAHALAEPLPVAQPQPTQATSQR